MPETPPAAAVPPTPRIRVSDDGTWAVRLADGQPPDDENWKVVRERGGPCTDLRLWLTDDETTGDGWRELVVAGAVPDTPPAAGDRHPKDVLAARIVEARRALPNLGHGLRIGYLLDELGVALEGSLPTSINDRTAEILIGAVPDTGHPTAAAEPAWPTPPPHGWMKRLYAAAHDIEPIHVVDDDLTDFAEVWGEMIEFDRTSLALALGLPTTEPNGDPVYEETIAEKCAQVRAAAVSSGDTEPAAFETCGLCGHAITRGRCGHAQAMNVPLCHADDHSCYIRWTVYNERPAGSGVTGQPDTAADKLAALGVCPHEDCPYDRPTDQPDCGNHEERMT